MERENDFSQGSIAKNILNLAVPMTLAQLINVLYSVVDLSLIHISGGRQDWDRWDQRDRQDDSSADDRGNRGAG